MARPPKSLSSFIGQSRVIDTLRQLADAARLRGVPLPHLMLIGPAGHGKTSLAVGLARYLGNFSATDRPSNLHTVQGGRGAVLRLREVLCVCKHADIVFVDEAHALGQPEAELLYIAIDDDRTLALTEDGRLDRTRYEPVAPVTIVLATNQPGRVPGALLSRTLPMEMSDYTLAELRAIAQRVAEERGVDLTSQAARVLAEHAHGSPRRVEQNVGLVAAMPSPAGRATQQYVADLLRRCFGHDDNGLSEYHRRLLTLLHGAGGALRAEHIVSRLGLDPAYVRGTIEATLVDRGLMAIGGDHVRRLTPTGRALAGGTATEADDLDAGVPNEEVSS